MHIGAPRNDRDAALRRFLVLAGLCGFAIGQPLLSALGDHPSTIAHHHVDGPGLLVFALVVAFLPPLMLWNVTSITAVVSRPLGWGLHLLAVGGLTALFAIQVAKELGLEGSWPLGVGALAVGAGFTLAYVRVDGVAMWASATALLPVLAVAFFALASPASALIRSPDEAPERDAGAGALPSVVVIVLDELPTKSLLDAEDRIDPVRFPNLARFGQEATWYRHHTAVATHTEVALPALVTGEAASSDPPLASFHPDNLFTLLAPTHELEVMETVTRLCPYTSCGPALDEEAAALADTDTGFGDLVDATVDLWVDRVSLTPAPLPALDDFTEDVTEPVSTTPSATSIESYTPEENAAILYPSARADAFTASFDARKGPALYFLHLMLPHQPWQHRADGEQYDPHPRGPALAVGDRPYAGTWNPWTAAVVEQRHLLQAEYTDALVGQMLDRLRDEGLYDDSLIVVTADHGISFEDGTQLRFPEPSTLDSIAYAPLLVKEPGQEHGAIDDSNVTGGDLLPTIADRLGVTPGWDVDGLPAGARGIRERGDAKQIYVEGTSRDEVPEDTMGFSDADSFPRAEDRWIGPITEDDDVLAGLTRRLELDGVLGRALDEVRTGDGGVAHIDAVAEVRQPPTGKAPMGMVTGRVPDAPPGARLILALNGVVIGGSELATSSAGIHGWFTVLLPQGILRPRNDVRVALVVDGAVEELRLDG